MRVYFLLASTAHWQRIKIGRAKDVEARIAALQIGSPTPLRLLGSLEASSLQHAVHIEGSLHRIFDAYHVDGEWFTAAQPLREYITAICSGNIEAARVAMEWAERQMKKRAIKKSIQSRRMKRA
jgi:hypothetical protein